MIAEKTSVCIQRNGGCVEIQNLSVSDLVYDHVSGMSDRIVRILKKTVSLNNRELSAYFPIVLSVGQVMDGRPTSTTLVSPRQQILMPDRNQPVDQPRKTSMYLAEDISTDILTGVDHIVYYAIFFQRNRFILANGVMMASYAIIN